MSGRPAFDELPVLPGVGLRHAWDLHADDQLGTVRQLTPAGVLEACHGVAQGRAFRLDLPLHEPDPPLFGRQPFRREVFASGRHNWDDKLDDLYLQGSTQWDGLRHVRCRELGFYGGITADPPDHDRLGIEHWARHGLIGRGVLLDVPRHHAAEGRTFDATAGTAIDAAELDAVARRQGVALGEGDVLCVRTGWVAAHRATDAAGRAEMATSRRFSGLAADEAMARFLWDAGIGALAVDNPAVEVSPGDPAVGSLHRRLIPALGMALGELFDFEDLAAASADDGRWDFLFVSLPLHVVGGIGSPANAMAIR